jgi:hypothetical protein
MQECVTTGNDPDQEQYVPVETEEADEKAERYGDSVPGPEVSL